MHTDARATLAPLQHMTPNLTPQAMLGIVVVRGVRDAMCYPNLLAYAYWALMLSPSGGATPVQEMT